MHFKLTLVACALSAITGCGGGGDSSALAVDPAIPASIAESPQDTQTGASAVPTPIAAPATEITPVPAPVVVAGTQHIISYGQSLSLGERSVVAFPDNPTLPGGYQNVGLMLADGVRSSGNVAALVPFAESTAPLDYQAWVTSTPGETPLYGALLALNGRAGTRIGSAAGRGGTPIAELSRGTAPYSRLLNQVRSAKAAATPPYGVPAIIWMHGEADAFNDGYAGQFSQLVSNLNGDIQAITGQAYPVHFHVCLTSYAVPAAAQRAVAAASPLVHIACDSSSFPKADGVHLLAAGSRAAGTALGNSIAASIN